jgi:hypothetical protein
MEVIAKLFYIDDLKHEINERSTAVDHAKFQSVLMLAVGESAVKQHRANATTVSALTRVKGGGKLDQQGGGKLDQRKSWRRVC